jgi:endonuclease YncB( thermonuclease family)
MIFLKYIIKYILLIIFIFNINTLFSKDQLLIKNLQVISIIDGDTLLLRKNNGENIKVRLLGIQAPELYSDPIWYYAKESKDAA